MVDLETKNVNLVFETVTENEEHTVISKDDTIIMSVHICN